VVASCSVLYIATGLCMSKLTNKQEMFCKEYLVDLNATQAAIRAGYKPDNAAVTGCENLIKPNVAARIQELMNKRSEKTEITAEWVLKGIESLTNELRQHEDPSKAYKGYELLGKHLKLFTDKIEQETTFTVIRKQYKVKDGN